MQVLHGNLWEQEADYYIITTNGALKSNKTAVMGRGVALQAKERFPSIDRDLGKSILRKGNTVQVIHTTSGGRKIVSLPVKHHWREKADTKLIWSSLVQLRNMAGYFSESTFVLPPPGTGNGRLPMREVLELLETVELPDNVMLVVRE